FGSHQRLDALLERLLDDLPDIPADTALIVATTKGAVDELLHHPKKPAKQQPWDIAANLAQRLDLTGQTSTVSAACASGTLALIHGAQLVISGEADQVLVVGVDLLSQFVTGGFLKLHALSPEPCRPFDKNRNGLSLGEGAGYALLTTREIAGAKGLPKLASIVDWGVACDASHITAPCKQASGLIAAIRQITEKGHVIGAINAHGTGTPYNDAMEMRAFKELWPAIPTFHSVKGAIGHCLGAAGIIEAAIAIRSLQEGFIPPTVGHVTSEPDVSGVSGSRSLELLYPSILSCNSGFGGINAAVLFSLRVNT
ncbi:MAG: beta-ketoacyl synthase, partial [Proteobacteria bacterium]|nr:beta-ketoacyl synthase [Pseudomonadota bacterium]